MAKNTKLEEGQGLRCKVQAMIFATRESWFSKARRALM